MHRAQYQSIAAAIAKLPDNERKLELISTLCAIFANCFSNFNKRLFTEACSSVKESSQ